ncbi:hypothetical protein V8C42DRAFT_348868 [Trichoderma barbatum]
MANMNTTLMPAEGGIKANLSSFFQFGRLPPELRCMIQERTARNFQRGAHFFAASETPRSSSHALAPSIFTFGRSYDFGLIAPKAKDNPDSAQDWLVGNPSAYIKDAGLWTACWESRCNMLRQYHRLGKHMNNHSWPSDIFLSCRFTWDREEYHFKVSPSQDLFCIQPLNTEAPWCVMPFYTLPGNSCPKRFMNLAIEYDIEWLNTSELDGIVPYWEDSPRGCFIRTLRAVAEGKMHAGFQFWVIDRNIQKRDKPLDIARLFPGLEDDDEKKYEKPEPLVFQGYGRRYVEVRDMSECKWDSLRRNTVFHFLHWLQITAGYGANWMMRHRTPAERSNPQLQFFDLEDLVKVLCEEKE